MTAIYVVNKSTLVSNADVHTMTRACARQIRYHLAPTWGVAHVPVTYTVSEHDTEPGSWVLAVLDDPDQADALGWHTEDQGDLVYGRVFARPVLDNGGDALTLTLSVASVLSHEVCETVVDPRCNTWADDGHGTMYAVEVCDPVESGSYPLPVTPRGASVPVNVTVSNFALPAWFDPNAATIEKVDYLGRATGPFQMTPGGYVVVRHGGAESQRFAQHYPDWRKDTKKADTARSARRIRVAQH